ncbi:MAG: glycosyltransferase [Mesorhizobium sp.]|nr:MAG: glycosyltransferase [Mesorhizobium sp.]
MKALERMDGMHRIVLIAPTFSDEQVLRFPFVSPAASAWIRGLVDALETFGRVDRSFWFSNESSWPRGPFLQPGMEIQSSSAGMKLVRFLNLPAIKRRSISRALERAVCAEVSREAFVFVYGQGTLSAAAVKRIGNLVQRVVVIVPDAPSNSAGLDLVKEVAKVATGGLLYLPASIGSLLGGRRCMAFHGTVSHVAEVSAPRVGTRKKLVFVGGVDKVSGSDFLVRALKRIDLSDIDVVVAGRVSDVQSAIALKEMGAQVTGFLNAAELDALCSDAYAFLNPRDPSFSASDTNFPSKLLKYMSYSRPILSTDTAGMPRDLVSVLGCSGVASPDRFADRLDGVLRQPESQWIAAATQVRKFAIEEYSVQSSARKIARFIGVPTPCVT